MTKNWTFYPCFVTNICHYFDLLEFVYSAKSYFNVILHIISCVTGHIKVKNIL